MEQIRLDNKTYIKVHTFAKDHWQRFYNRFGYSTTDRKNKVFFGKLGEAGAAKLLGGTMNYFKTDKEDLIVGKHTYTVKSRRVKGFPGSFDDYYVFIPKDQYRYALESSEYLIMMLIVGTANIHSDLSSNRLDIFYIGKITMKRFDAEKNFFKAGTQIAPFCKLPPPDSWGVPFGSLDTTVPTTLTIDNPAYI